VVDLLLRRAVIKIANETTITVSLVDSGANVSHTPSSFNVDRTGDNVISFTQVIGTGNEALLVNTDIGTAGRAYFENMDGTNFIEIGLSDSYTIKLLAGEKCVVPVATRALFAQAHTAPITLRCSIMER